MMLEKYKTKLNCKKWKEVLNVCEDAIVICNSTEILYYNSSMSNLLGGEKNKTAIELKINQILENTKIIGSEGKTIYWQGFCFSASLLNEDKYLIYNSSENLVYTLIKRIVNFEDQEASLIFIREPSQTEKTHMKVTEEKYKKMMISTITHDMKTPIMSVKGNLEMLFQYIANEGQDYLNAALITITAFEYYIYDLIVYNNIYIYVYRILIN